MIKKITACCFTLFFIISSCLCVNAAYRNSAMSIISTYYCDGYLTAYVKPQDAKKAKDSKAYVTVKGNTVTDEIFRKPNNSTAKVTYMLLVDASTSMPNYKDRINSFAKSLLKEENAKNKQITVAVFGDKFKVIKKNLKNASKVVKAINSIEYNQESTNISGNVSDAISYLSNSIKKNNEIVNLIVLTDGIPYLNNSIISSLDNLLINVSFVESILSINFAFLCCKSYIFSSIEFFVINLYT